MPSLKACDRCQDLAGSHQALPSPPALLFLRVPPRISAPSAFSPSPSPSPSPFPARLLAFSSAGVPPRYVGQPQVYDLLRRGARDRVCWGVPGVNGDPADVPGWDEYYGHGLIDIEASLFWLEELYCPGC